MFYLIIAILVLSYYIFMAPKTVRSTIDMIGLAAVLVCLSVLAVMSFMEILNSPPEFFVGIAMIVLAWFSIKDVLSLTSRKK